MVQVSLLAPVVATAVLVSVGSVGSASTSLEPHVHDRVRGTRRKIPVATRDDAAGFATA